jgi:hypothetical protein
MIHTCHPDENAIIFVAPRPIDTEGHHDRLSLSRFTYLRNAVLVRHR